MAQQLPDSFKPINMPDSFKPIIEDEEDNPSILRRLESGWNTINKPLIDIRSGGLKTATDEFAQEHPIIGNTMNFLTDTLSSLTSPLSVGLGLTGISEGLAAKAGLTRAAKALSAPAKLAEGAMVAHGGYNLTRPDASLSERAGGLLEAGGGVFGLSRGLGKAKLNPAENPSILMKNELPEPAIKSDLEPRTPGLVTDVDVPVIVPPFPPQQKLLEVLKSSRRLNKAQREIYRVERADKFSKAANINVESEADVPKFFGALKGKHTKVDIEPLRDVMQQPDIDELYAGIGKSSIPETDKAHAYTGITKLLSGAVPVDSEITALGDVFGLEFGNELAKRMPMTSRRLITELGAIPKALKSAGDFGFPFRQGRNLAYRTSWFKSLVPMMKGYGSQKFFDERMNLVRSDPEFAFARDSGIAFTDLGLGSRREESAVASMVGGLPLVRNSNRAATLMGNELRFNEFKRKTALYQKAYESGMKTAKTAEEINAAKMMNPKNPYVASKLADDINVATGRGKLPGSMEKIATEANAFLFSPRLMSARIRSIGRILNRTANPFSNTSSIERKEAVKQLLSIAAAGATEAVTMKMIAKAAGYEPTIELSPDSSDFMKVKIDNTRYDPFGGYQQYFVPLFKILMGSATSTRSGERYELGENPIVPNRFDVLVDSLANKASPPLGLGIGILKGSEPGGRKLDFTSLNPAENTLTRYLADPIILQDMYDIIQEDPALLPLLVPDMFGQSSQVYEH